MSFELNHTEVSELTDIRSQLFMMYYDKKNIFVMNNAVVENNLLVKGNMYFNDLENSGKQTIHGNVVHLSDSSFCDVSMNSAYIDGDVEITGGVDISNNAQIGGKMSVGKPLNDAYELDVSGDVVISGNLRIEGSLDLVRGGNDSSSNEVIDGNLTVEGTLDVSDNVTLGGDLIIAGDTSMNSLKVSSLHVDEIEIEDTLTMTHITITEGLDFSSNGVGIAIGDSMKLNADLSCNSFYAEDASINSIQTIDVTAGGNLNVSGTTSIGSTLDVGDNITCNGGISASDDTSIGGNLTVSGQVDIGANVSIGGNVSIDTNGNIDTSGNMILRGDIDLSGNADISNNLTVNGETNLQTTNLGLLTSTSDGVELAKIYNDDVAGGVFYASNVGYDDNRIPNIYVKNLIVDGSHNITEALSSPSFEVNSLFISNSGEGADWQGIEDVALDVSGNTYVFGNLSVGRNLAYNDSSNNYDINEYELDISGCTHIDGTLFHTKGTIPDYGNTNQRLPSSIIHYYTAEEVVDASSNTELNLTCRGEIILESRHSPNQNDVVGNLASGIEFRTNDELGTRWPLAYIMSSTKGFGDSQYSYSGGLNFYVTPSGNQTEWNDDNIGSGIDVCGNFTNGVSDTPKLALAMDETKDYICLVS